jgi:hypothetical protein
MVPGQITSSTTTSSDVADGPRGDITRPTAQWWARLVVDGGASSAVDGVQFMRAIWSLWFGKSSPLGLGDELLGDL